MTVEQIQLNQAERDAVNLHKIIEGYKALIEMAEDKGILAEIPHMRSALHVTETMYVGALDRYAEAQDAVLASPT